MSKIETVSEPYSQDVLLEPKANFYIINALGDIIWIKTRKREKAQEWVDSEYGKGKYTVVCIKVSGSRDNNTVRGSETRWGQSVQRQKAKILNS